jgi:hypothetical protein
MRAALVRNCPTLVVADLVPESPTAGPSRTVRWAKARERECRGPRQHTSYERRGRWRGGGSVPPSPSSSSTSSPPPPSPPPPPTPPLGSATSRPLPPPPSSWPKCVATIRVASPRVPEQGSDLGHAPGLGDELRRRDDEGGGGGVVGGGPDPAGAGRSRDRGNVKESFEAAEGGVHGPEFTAAGAKVVAQERDAPGLHREGGLLARERKSYREHRPDQAALLRTSGSASARHCSRGGTTVFAKSLWTWSRLCRSIMQIAKQALPRIRLTGDASRPPKKDMGSYRRIARFCGPVPEAMFTTVSRAELKKGGRRYWGSESVRRSRQIPPKRHSRL